MKILITFFLLASFQSAFCQKTYTPLNFTLIGQVKNMLDGKIVIYYEDYKGNKIIDTSDVKKGQFDFSGQISQPTYVYLENLSSSDINHTEIYIEGTKQYIYLVLDSFAYARMDGSATQKENEILDNSYRQIENKWNVNSTYEEIIAEYTSEDDTILKAVIGKKLDSLRPFIDSMNSESKRAKMSFIENYPNSYVSAYNLLLPLSYLPYDSARELFDNLNIEIKKSRIGQILAAKLQLKAQNNVGATAPNFSATTSSGKEIEFSSFKGKYVLLDFWASWCGPCREAIPHLKELFTQYHSSGLEIITISIDKSKSSWEKAVEQENINTWNNVIVNNSIEKNYENVHLPIPSSILVNKEGLIIWKSEDPNGPNELGAFLKGIFQ